MLQQTDIIGKFMGTLGNPVPVWVAAWRGRELPAAPDASEAEQPHIRLRLFLSLLLFCIGMTLLVWLIRLAQGSGESYYESLNYWTYTDSHHYLDIARDGYISAADVPGLIERGVFADEDAAWDRLVQLVFLPGYPVAVGLMYLLVRDYLLLQLLELHIPTVVALNMMDELTGNGGSVNVQKPPSSALWR